MHLPAFLVRVLKRLTRGFRLFLRRRRPIETRWAKALMDQSTDRKAHLGEVTDKLRIRMEAQSIQVRDLIITQPPVQLLGYLQAKFHTDFSAAHDEADETARLKQKELIKTYQFALEYAHAVWCCHARLLDESSRFHEHKASELFQALEVLERTTGMYCMASTAATADSGQRRASSDTEFHAKSTWTLIRGHRYQVLEQEFFQFVLAPHSEALQAAYGMDANAIAAEMQAITDSMRLGFSEAAGIIKKGMERAEIAGLDFQAAVTKLRERDDPFAKQMSDAIQDLFYAGICNLSRHTKFSVPLLEDLSYLPGANAEFFADGELKGTPMRTLPARIRPGIRLSNDYYVTDGQFIRDSAYRAIQRGLLNRNPSYREEWNRRQKNLVERAYPTIFRGQLDGATIYSEVYFKDLITDQWVETDLVMALVDVLFVIEAKAGVMAMHSPATNFDRHERTIQELIIKAYEQCKRFLEYLASAAEVSIYTRSNSEFVEVGRLRQRDYRFIFPIGLTIESFTPFSAMCKEFPEIRPLLDKHPFISMSVDDLFVLTRFLPTTGGLLHYLEVRQAVAGIPRAMLFDEIDHLGAYITKNRFDIDIQEQLKEANIVVWDSFGNVVDKHFEGESWSSSIPPHQGFPEELAAILLALDEHRPGHWLSVDAHIRNLGGEARTNFARVLSELKPTLRQYPRRRFLIGGGDSLLLVWLCRRGSEPPPAEMRYHGEAACLAMNALEMLALIVSLERDGAISSVDCGLFDTPSPTQPNYPTLMQEAERQRSRFTEFGRGDGGE